MTPTLVQTERLLECRQCHGSYGEDFFQLHEGASILAPRRKLRCIGCSLTRRTEEKNSGQRFIVKARNALMSHGHRLARKGFVTGPEDLARRFGWDVARMAHDIEHAFENWCSYCSRPYSTMPNGLEDVTFDIVDPKQPPYYTTNCKICCQTCNRGKSKTSPGRWAKKLLWWQEWRRQQQRLKEDQSLISPLFACDVQGIPV